MVFKKEINKYKRSEKELNENSNFRLKYVRSDLMSRIIKIVKLKKKERETKMISGLN